MLTQMQSKRGDLCVCIVIVATIWCMYILSSSLSSWSPLPLRVCMFSSPLSSPLSPYIRDVVVIIITVATQCLTIHGHHRRCHHFVSVCRHHHYGHDHRCHLVRCPLSVLPLPPFGHAVVTVVAILCVGVYMCGYVGMGMCGCGCV